MPPISPSPATSRNTSLYTPGEEIANSVTHGIGIILRLFLRGRLHGLVVTIYLAMGWAVVVAVQPMLENVALGGLLLLAGGGLAYTVGVIFYKWRGLKFHHAIWHGFVMLGSALHFFAVLFYVIPWPVAVAA
jgi:hemolysin III